MLGNHFDSFALHHVIAAKSGVEPSGCVELVKHVSLNCPNLQICGLMTIGMPDYTSTPENFKTLANCRSEVCKALGIPEEQCELSMGMSSDFELAVRTICILPLSNFGFVYNLPLKYRTISVPLVASYAQSHAMFTQTWMCLKYELKWAVRMSELDQPSLEQGNIPRKTETKLMK
ncbi:hypothetical protein Golax_004100 [Gossypium laxum]|uniref:Uncharacterized protein n=1 Tax=Gossypium laxum TaxID=34288 RepID=A0A7J9AHG6_9ROSI|nr:hypothetical protein [Gossypium laxum]